MSKSFFAFIFLGTVLASACSKPIDLDQDLDHDLALQLIQEYYLSSKTEIESEFGFHGGKPASKRQFESHMDFFDRVEAAGIGTIEVQLGAYPQEDGWTESKAKALELGYSQDTSPPAFADEYIWRVRFSPEAEALVKNYSGKPKAVIVGSREVVEVTDIKFENKYQATVTYTEIIQPTMFWAMPIKNESQVFTERDSSNQLEAQERQMTLIRVNDRWRTAFSVFTDS